MRRVPELVDRGHRLQAVAAAHQHACVAGEAAGIAETPTTTGTFDSAIRRSAPRRRPAAGSNTIASKRSSSGARSGRRKRSRRSVVTVRTPPRLAEARSRALSAPPPRPRRHGRCGLRPSASEKAPARRTGRPRAWPWPPPRRRGGRASPRPRRWPGGSRRRWHQPERPAGISGARRTISTSPWSESRARSSSPASSTRLCRARSEAGPWPRMSTSRPPAVAVTCTSRGFPPPPRRGAG